MPYHEFPRYLFTCFFNTKVKCSGFKPKHFRDELRTKGIIPNPCKHCDYYTKRPQQNLDLYIVHPDKIEGNDKGDSEY